MLGAHERENGGNNEPIGRFDMKTDEMGVLWGRGNELIEEVEMTFPKNNLILRDVDGQPIYLKDYHPLGEEDFISTLE